MLQKQAHPFDVHLLKHITFEWRKMARIVGTAIGELDSKQRDELSLGSASPLDLLFAQRLEVLAQEGLLEYQGELNRMGYCELRLPEAL